MTVKKYITNQLKTSGLYRLTADDKVLLNQGIINFTMKKLMSKKFRKWKLEQSCVDRTERAIKLQVESKKPIKIIYFQGGYKLWRFPSAPEADWAEFFNISYVLDYLAPIAAAYKPGVELIYYCHTLLMEKHDNLTSDEVNKYMNSLQKLIDKFSENIPENITINIIRDSDIYSRNEYFEALEIGRKKAENDVADWSADKMKKFERMARLNIKWDGKEDWTKLSESKKNGKIHLAALYEHAATNNLPKVMEIVKAPNIVLLFTVPSPIFIGIGSTYASVAKHWVGFGILEVHKDSYLPRILSPSQFENIKSIKHEVKAINLSLGSNLKIVRVYSEPTV